MMNNKIEKAIVLGGGGSFAISWELGYLYGLFENGVDVRDADRMIGTSSGSPAAAVFASDLSWKEILHGQIDLRHDEQVPLSDMSALFERYAKIAKESENPQAWMENYRTLALEPNRIDEDTNLSRIKKRINLTEWTKNLYVTATSAETAQRVVFDATSNVDLHKAITASSSLPGVWPAITIKGQKYYDGGCHSMDNADVAKNADQILVLSPSLPVDTPYKPEDDLKELRASGARVLVVKPSEEVRTAFKELGGNTVDTRIRPILEKMAKKQGLQEAKKIKEFWK